MRKHRLYLVDSAGGVDGFNPQLVCIDEPGRCLRIGKRFTVPLREIMAAEVRPLPARPKIKHLAIDVCGPTVENGKPTTIPLIHRNFFLQTKVEPMQALVDELAPLIHGNTPLSLPEVVVTSESRETRLQAQYALNFSLLVGFYRKLWFTYDTPRAAVVKSLLLMLFNGVLNAFGVLLVVVPFDNFKMSRNLVKAGWPKVGAVAAYVVLSYPAYVWWVLVVLGWVARRGHG